MNEKKFNKRSGTYVAISYYSLLEDPWLEEPSSPYGTKFDAEKSYVLVFFDNKMGGYSGDDFHYYMNYFISLVDEEGNGFPLLEERRITEENLEMKTAGAKVPSITELSDINRKDLPSPNGLMSENYTLLKIIK